MIKDDLQLFEYELIDNNADKTLFLLHGTGGNKTDFLFLDDFLDGQYNLVGLQGNIHEDGLTRFFRRFAIGVFDQENITQETTKFEKFLQAWIDKNELSPEQLTFLGYSNGANMILAMLFRFPNLIRKALLLHPMLPFAVDPHSLDLSHHRLFVTQGENDEMISNEEHHHLSETLRAQDAEPTFKIYSAGHSISQPEMKEIIQQLLR